MMPNVQQIEFQTEEIFLKAHTPHHAEGTGKAWVVENNFVDLFFTEIHADGAPGRRHHVVRLEPGDVMFDLPIMKDGSYIFVGSATLTRWAPAGEANREIAQKIDKWIIGTTPTPRQRATDPVVLQAGDQVSMKPGDSFLNTGKPLWLSGGPSLLIDGIQEIACTPAKPIPFAARSWASLSKEGDINTQYTEDILRDKELTDLLAVHHFLLAGRLRSCIAGEGDAFRDTVAQSKEYLGQQHKNAFRSLISVLGNENEPTAPSKEEGLTKALRKISDCLDVTLPDDNDNPLTQKDVAVDLHCALDSTGLRYRQIQFLDGWWKREAGPLLGFLDETLERPVALLPYKGGYKIFDPATGAEKRVTGKIAAQIAVEGYTFYAALPDHSLSKMDAARFSISGSKGDLLFIAIASIATAMLGALAPYFTGLLISDAIPSSDLGLLIFIALALAGAAIAKAIFALARGFATLALESKSDSRIEAAIWDRILKQPATFFRQYNSGELAMRAAGLSAARKAVSQASTHAFFGAVSIPVQLGMMYAFYPSLAHWALGVTVIALIIYVVLSRMTIRARTAEILARTKLSGVMLQLLTGIAKIRVAGNEARAFDQWAIRFAEQKKYCYEAQKRNGWLSIINSALPTITMLVVFAVVAYKLIPNLDHTFRASDFLGFIAALAIFQSSVMSIAGAALHSAGVMPLVDLAEPILKAIPESADKRDLAPKLTGKITMERIQFRYSEDGPQVLKDVSIEANEGEFVALVGPSGSGKSTAFRLLLGFETPDTGTITYDGNDLSDMELRSVRKQIGVVLQTGKIMPGTILANVTGPNNYDQDAVWEALAMAGMEEDIQQMPMGLYTTLSEGGGTLSGGQRQRLLIARAIVGRPRIMLMDEATSALDNRTQEIVSQSLARMNATRIVIAHRLSTIQDADRIYVLRNGVVEEVGNAEELMARDGLFAQMARRQIV